MTPAPGSFPNRSTDSPINRFTITDRCIVAGILGLLVTVILTGGCAQRQLTTAPAQQAVGAAATGVAGIVAHTESAQRHVEAAIPEASVAGKIELKSATAEHQAVIRDVAATRVALDTTQTRIDDLGRSLAGLQADYTKLEGRWYVRWGRWIERMLWIIGITWLALGVASIVLGMSNPIGWLTGISKEIVRFLPAMNIFAWLRDWIRSWRTVASAPTPASGSATGSSAIAAGATVSSLPTTN